MLADRIRDYTAGLDAAVTSTVRDAAAQVPALAARLASAGGGR